MTSVLEPLVAAFPLPDRAVDFSDRPVDDEALAAVLGAARVAPSADNLQTWRFVVVRAAETRARLGEAAGGAVGATLHSAPLGVAVCGVRAFVTRKRREQPFVWIDVPIALSHLLLQATELGLGCAWTHQLDEARVRATLSIPDDVRVVALLGLGWPAP
jgi:nitroreductase